MPFPQQQGVVGEDDPQAHAGGTRARIAEPDSSSLGMNPSTRLFGKTRAVGARFAA